jgi:hypothetical protein
LKEVFEGLCPVWSGLVRSGPVGSGRVRPVWSGLVRSGLSGRPERSLKALEGLCPVFSGLPAFEGLLWGVFEGHWGVFWGLWEAFEGLCPVFSGLPAFEGLLWGVFEGHWGVFWGLWKAFGRPWGVFGRSFGGLWEAFGGLLEAFERPLRSGLKRAIYFDLLLSPFWYIFEGLGRPGNDFERHGDVKVVHTEFLF